MKSKFYHGLKENLDSGDFSAKKCALLMDEYTSSFKCKGDECSKLSDIKEGFAYILHKYKYISRLQKQLKKFPQAKFLRIYTHQLAWNKRNTALPIYPHYETNIPKQTYLYNLRTGKQYKLPKFLSPAL